MQNEESGVPVTMPHLLLLSGATCYDSATPPQGRSNAKRVFDELLACAVAHGFSEAGHLRHLLNVEMISRHGVPKFPKRAIDLAHAALDHVPADAIRKALARAGALDLLIGEAS